MLCALALWRGDESERIFLWGNYGIRTTFHDMRAWFWRAGGERRQLVGCLHGYASARALYLCVCVGQKMEIGDMTFGAADRRIADADGVGRRKSSGRVLRDERIGRVNVETKNAYMDRQAPMAPGDRYRHSLFQH